jgi:hypothetical protein
MYAAWSGAYMAATDWVVGIEDDALLAPDFSTAFFSALAEPHPPAVQALTFYRNDRADLDCLARGERWRLIPARQFHGLVCIAVRRAVVPAILAHWEEWPDEKLGIALGDLFSRRGWEIRCHVPSLVQHLDTDSILGHRTRPRRSRSFTAAYGEIDGNA